jgi:hypothetical protein
MFMPTRNAECSSLSHTPVLTAPLLNRIQQLNLEYLQLLSDAPRNDVCVHVEAMPLAIRSSLSSLPPSGLQLLAAAPYAMYTLAFDDQDLWLATLADGEPCTPGLQVADSANSACRLQGHAAFCETVIFFAWHVAVANRLAARMSLGMPAAVIERLQPTSFRKLQQVMRAAPWLLMPRWPNNPRFWPDLLQLAALGDADCVRQAQLLGSQLIASDLRVAESPQPEVAGRLRAARHAQLQRWKLRHR